MPKTVKERCKQILMGKLSNYKEYLNLPEYNNLVQLIEKGRCDPSCRHYTSSKGDGRNTFQRGIY